MLLTKEVIIKWNSRTRKWYEQKGYVYTKMGNELKVKVEDLSVGSTTRVNVRCDCCLKDLNLSWSAYLKRKHQDKSYCYECAMKLYGLENRKKVHLSKVDSFEEWCINNNRLDVLERWDYNLNNIKPSDITYGTDRKVYLTCPRKIHESELKEIHSFTKGQNGSVYCRKCNSFGQWCLDNDRHDILNRWDYKLNQCKPDEISYGINKKYYFRCPQGKHASELKDIGNFTGGQEGSMNCNQCNSLAQWGIDNIGEVFLDKYWDWDRNNKLNINPWKISRGSTKKVWIKCQEKDYHESYKTLPSTFTSNLSRCPLCSKHNGKVHYLDSLASEKPNSIVLWSDKNSITPYQVTKFSIKSAWWKCNEGIHQDYKRNIALSTQCDFRCPECSYSKGEERVNNFLKYSSIQYERQKEFNDLKGIGNGNLSYDFYLPNFNLLIEYQGEFHDGSAGSQNDKSFKRQQEHDKRKREYALNQGIKLLEIWHWDFNNTEEILKKELNL